PLGGCRAYRPSPRRSGEGEGQGLKPKGGHLMSRDLNERPPLIETVPISDIFASELGRIEKIGPCARLVFAVTQAGGYDDGTVGQERVVVARIVLPLAVLPSVLEALLGRAEAPSRDEVARLKAVN